MGKTIKMMVVCVCACCTLREISHMKNEQGEFLLSLARLCRAGNRTEEIKPCLDSSALAIVSPGSVFIPSVLIQGRLLLLNGPVPADMFLACLDGRVLSLLAHMVTAAAVTHV